MRPFASHLATVVRRPALAFVALAAADALLSSCGSGCDSSDPPALLITVVGGGGEALDSVGGAGGAPARGDPTAGAFVRCRAEVSVGPAPDKVSCSTDGNDCACSVQGRAGSYVVLVELDGETERETVEVDEGCRVETEELCFFGECDG